MSSIRSHATARVAAIAACITLSAESAAAQDVPTAFVHGMNGTASSWEQTANYLVQQFRISQIRPSMGWSNVYATQATNLHAAIGTASGIPAIGNSNGGMVMRRYVQQYGAGSRINRMAIVGSLHNGAPLADRALDGSIFHYAAAAGIVISDPITYYYANDWQFQDAWLRWALMPLRYAAEGMYLFARNLDIWIHYSGGMWIPQLVGATVPVLNQMSPSSSFIQTLNSSANLNAEAVRLPVRVSSTSTIRPDNVLFRTLTSDPQAWARVRASLQHSALILAIHYRDHPDFFLRANHVRWLRLYWFLHDMDAHWHWMIGSLIQYNGFFAQVHPQDGILPIYTMRWPGNTRLRERLSPAYDIGHFEQRNHPSMRNLYEAVFEEDFAVPRRTPPGGGGPPPGGCIPDPPLIICPESGPAG